MNKRILVTGGTGFQGSNLSKSLLSQGYEVTILNTPGDKNDKNVKRFQLEGAKIIWGSINDKDVVFKALEGVDLVINTAAKIHVDDSIKNPTKYFQTNVMGTHNLLEGVREFNIPLMHISTCEVYGFQDEELNEESPLMPNSPYAASKAAADRMVYAYVVTYGIKACIIRPFNVFGFGQKSGECGAVIPRWSNMILNNQDIMIYGDGKQSREFIHINDVISAYDILIDKLLNTDDINGKVINIGTGVEVFIDELAITLLDVIKQKMNSNSKIIYQDSRPGEVKKFISNSDYMKSFGWEPKYDLKKGLTDYLKREFNL